MARGNRSHSGEQNVQRSVQIPESLWERVQEDLADPLTGRIKHGKFSQLITYLLRKHYGGGG